MGRYESALQQITSLQQDLGLEKSRCQTYESQIEAMRSSAQEMQEQLEEQR